ncbi:MAG: hypothetical protein LRY40_03020 [Shewanella fodinae]|nr:hypothetical protein [Shewanella fodinae]
MRQEMDEMKQRLVTLEQIVTDESYQLKKQKSTVSEGSEASMPNSHQGFRNRRLR